MFYDVFKTLCERKQVSCKKAAEEMGLSNSITTKWKKTGATPSGETLAKVAAYFGVSADYLLEKEEDLLAKGSEISDDDIKFALFEGAKVTDEQFEEVKRFARYVRDRGIHST